MGADHGEREPKRGSGAEPPAGSKGTAPSGGQGAKFFFHFPFSTEYKVQSPKSVRWVGLQRL